LALSQPMSLSERLAIIEGELSRAEGLAAVGGLRAPHALPAAVALVDGSSPRAHLAAPARRARAMA
jgi:hypothetical protein